MTVALLTLLVLVQVLVLMLMLTRLKNLRRLSFPLLRRKQR